MSHDPQLAIAARIWRSGNPIPADLAAILASRGYDVGALEARHLNN